MSDFVCDFPNCDCQTICRATGREVGRRTIVRFDGEHAFLSNFHPSPVRGPLSLLFPTVEHAFQAAKCVRSRDVEMILDARTPGIAKRMGRGVEMRSNWDEIRVEVMEELVWAKFTAPTLRTKLLSTGDAKLIEGNTWGDTFWGVCNGIGENNLGKILMRVRERIRRMDD